jgi:hypothetical protein
MGSIVLAISISFRAAACSNGRRAILFLPA